MGVLIGGANAASNDPSALWPILRATFSVGAAVEVRSDVGKRDDGDRGVVWLLGVHPDALIPEIPKRGPVTTPT